MIGAGPAGLSAAVEAAEAGMRVAVFDENAGPGGQLFKQIHKFFGSRDQNAMIRGFQIGRNLLARAEAAGVEVFLNAPVMGIYKNHEVLVKIEDESVHFKGDNIIIAAGAAEVMVPFCGWDLPGVMGAGAAQTLMNRHGVLPGRKVLLVGSGNVGLIVGLQLLQAGCELVAVLDAAPRVGGYGVHAAKIARTGVPFLTSTTILEAKGDGKVEKAVIRKVDSRFQVIPGTERELDVDTILMAVGLSPMTQLASCAGCDVEYSDQTGRLSCITVTDEFCETTVAGIYCCGDFRMETAEGASSAILQGQIAASHIAEQAGYITGEECGARIAKCQETLRQMSGGMFSVKNKGRVDPTETDEGYPISRSLLERGYIAEEELQNYPAASYEAEGVHPVIECVQNIPCNPCRDMCARKCILVNGDITNIPLVDQTKKCVGCGLCVANCPGQSIFLIDKTSIPDYAAVSIPYEFLPLPEEGQKGTGLDRSGAPVCDALVMSVKTSPAMDKTAVLTMKVPLKYADSVRFFKAEGGAE